MVVLSREKRMESFRADVQRVTDAVAPVLVGHSVAAIATMAGTVFAQAILRLKDGDVCDALDEIDEIEWGTVLENILIAQEEAESQSRS